MPFGTVGNNELGTYFICYASTFSTVRKMLMNMFTGVDGANYDRLLDFSTAVTGTLFFVPTVDMLGDFAGEINRCARLASCEPRLRQEAGFSGRLGVDIQTESKQSREE